MNSTRLESGLLTIEACFFLCLAQNSSFYEDPESMSCTTSTVSSCFFSIHHDTVFCKWQGELFTGPYEWETVNKMRTFDGFMNVLNDAKKVPTKLATEFASEVQAICVTASFFIFTFGSDVSPIEPLRFYLRDSNGYQLMHEARATTLSSSAFNSDLQKREFACCLPNLGYSDTRKIALQAASNDKAIVALDYITIRLSEMNCTGDNLQCYPPPPYFSQSTATSHTLLHSTKPDVEPTTYDPLSPLFNQTTVNPLVQHSTVQPVSTSGDHKIPRMLNQTTMTSFAKNSTYTPDSLSRDRGAHNAILIIACGIAAVGLTAIFVGVGLYDKARRTGIIDERRMINGPQNETSVGLKNISYTAPS